MSGKGGLVRVALYARVSTGSEEQSQALEQQLARLEASAASHNDPDPERFIDIASGSRDDRPELARLLATCSQGTIGTVIVTRLDRLSRSSAHGAQLLRYFSEARTPNLIALDDSIDLSTSSGRFMARNLISWAEAESDRLGERTRHGQAFRRTQRKPFGSVPLWGYRFTENRDRLEPDPDLFPIAQQAVAKFLEDPRTNTLMTWFHKEHGIRWGSNYSLRRWLCNPTLTGARAYGQQIREVDPLTGRKRNISRPPGDYAEIHWADEEGQPFQTSLLTRVQHARILAVFHARSRPSTRPLAEGNTRPLTGLITCADCGRNIHHHRPGKGASYWCMRCVTTGCPSQYKTLREQEIRFALLAFLQQHAEQLVRHVDEMKALQDGKLSPEAEALRETIMKLEAMDDPDLQPVLDKKKAALAVMIESAAAGGAEAAAFLEQVKTFQLPEIGLASEQDPENTRRILKRFITAEARAGELVTMTVAESIRRPGMSATFNCEGMGLGRKPSNKTQTAPMPGSRS
ncbi:recombinase family protein [Synechococcus sp. BIOS-E4-1]|uniref:recombinase family protein n=1 Tax=Synechococcus sp. BIOS-E4-1 TaxID=1400864 RepID=UPI001CA44DD2|nr:recombinase family protein [Synechococcus sp. BIOS-E4-1]